MNWHEFTQNTTIHGVRYIFEGHNFRRMLWCLCVLGSFSVFSWQVVERTLSYLERNTNVDVEVVYGNRVPFPTVTLCNQNTFRLTESNQHGLYQLLEDLYGDGSLTVDEVVAKHPILADSNLKQYLPSIAHQQEDFIMGCTWLGVDCNMTADIHAVHTDFGLCFTFNLGVDGKTLYSTRTGAGKGLSLVLNIERYEYMSGPQNEIGVQLLLHHNNEVPQMKSLGFAVSPGTHTLVGVNRKESTSLEAPYGICVSSAAPISNCTVENEMSTVRELCGCQSVFSGDIGVDPDADNVTSCNMTMEYFCIQSDSRDGASDKLCDIPCKRVLYEPSLSYALLAKHNIVKEVFRNSKNISADLQDLQDKVTLAVETLHAVDTDIVASDALVVDSLVSSAAVLSASITDISLVLGTTQTMASRLQVADVMSAGLSAIESDYETWSALLSERHEEYMTASGLEDLLTTIELTTDIEQLYFMLDGTKLAEDIQHCIDQGILDISDQPRDMRCNAAIDTIIIPGGLSDTANTLITQVDPYISSDILASYNQVVDLLFSDTAVNVSDNTEHVACVEELTHFESAMAEYLVFHEIISNNPYLEAVDGILLEINNVSTIMGTQEFWDSVQALDQSDLGRCTWIFSSSASDYWQHYGNSAEVDIRKLAERKFADAQPPLTSSVGRFEVLQDTIRNVRSKYTKSLYHLDRLAEAYQNKTTTMSHLAQQYDKVNIQAKLVDLVTTLDDFATRASELDDDLEKARKHISAAYGELWSLSIPLYNYSTLFASRVWTDVIMTTNLTTVVSAREEILSRDQWPPDLETIVDAIFNSYTEYLRDVVNDILDQSSTYEDDMLNMEATLESFLLETTISDELLADNIAKVDIFYKELSYQKVTQRKAFEILSLLSEVGGFLGLLLGASVLTVCELVDFLLLKVCFGCKRRKVSHDEMLPQKMSYQDIEPQKVSHE